MTNILPCLLGLALISAALPSQSAAQNPDSSPRAVQLVPVSPDVKLEVLDWGGTGHPLVFLAGMGMDAHEFDTFAPRFSGKYHVYGISRRGFGKSSSPIPDKDNYTADRLGDDVLAVCSKLNLERPVLVGHSLAGEELSSIGTRYPERVSGLIYLEAGYPYALYTPAVGDPILDAKELQHQLDLLFAASLQTPADFAKIEMTVARFDQDLKDLNAKLAVAPAPPPRSANAPPILLALVNGAQMYTTIHVPALAIFAVPLGKLTTAQADAFQAGASQAHVVRIPGADHFVFRSNEQQVFEEMSAFLSSLPLAAWKTLNMRVDVAACNVTR